MDGKLDDIMVKLAEVVAVNSGKLNFYGQSTVCSGLDAFSPLIHPATIIEKTELTDMASKFKSLIQS